MQVCSRCSRENPTDGRFCSYCGLSLAGRERVIVRRNATLLFIDLVGSTALGERLDPEALTAMLQRYFTIAQSTIESHGGTVMKFIGDAVVAVFGLPITHEDDPTRAARAIWELLERVDALNAGLRDEFGIEIGLRAGINTGEVAADANALEESFVFGDTANTAARLEQHAPTGGVLIGEQTYRAARADVVVEEVDPIVAKGKSEPVRAFRLDGIRTVAEARRSISGSALVGRSDQLERLLELVRVADEPIDDGPDRRVPVVTLVGEPGLGKSRLISELRAAVDPPHRALIGHCLSYGEVTGYWPIRDMLNQLAAADDTDPGRVLNDALDAQGATFEQIWSVGGAFGLGAGAPAADDVALAVERLMRHVAATGPLTIIIDDLHWASTAMVRLLERLARSLTDQPVIIVCATRPEFLEAHPQWRELGEVIDLQPLDGDLADRLIDDLVRGGARLDRRLADRIRESAGGNPLFLEQTITMLFEDDLVERVGNSFVAKPGAFDALPSSLQALLSSRIDQLPPTESDILSRIAVAGQLFDLADLAVVAPDRTPFELRAAAAFLTERGLIDRAPGGDAYSFRHDLIRDAAYERLGKADRADTHVAIAAHKDTGDDDQDELVGYHLEQAFRNRSDLRTPNAADLALAGEGAIRLQRAGRAAERRGDVESCVDLLRRALGLDEQLAGRHRLRVDLGAALIECGRFDQAIAVFDEVVAEPDLDDDTALLLEVNRGYAELHIDSDTDARHLHERASYAVARFSEIHDDAAVLHAGWVVVLTSMVVGAASQGRVAIDRMRTTIGGGSSRFAGRIPGMLAMNLAWGPTPVGEALTVTTELLREVDDDPSAEPLVLAHHAYLLALTGNIDAARAALVRVRTLLERQGQRLALWGAWSQGVGRSELDGGDPAKAEAAVREGLEALLQLGERGFAATLAGQLAHILIRLERGDEADPYVELCRAETGQNDVLGQVLWRTAQARRVAATDLDTAIELADAAVDIAETAEWPTIRGQALLHAAWVHSHRPGSAERVTALIDTARTVFAAKGNVAGSRRTDELAAELGAPAAE